MGNYKNQWVKAIKVDGVPDNTIGQILYSDNIGRFYVRWENGTMGVIRERGDVYQFIYEYIPQKNIWNIKRLFLLLLKKFKQFYYGN
jgi:hypothetical protein